MCRGINEGGRRCRWHTAPTSIAISNAQRRVAYHEGRYDVLADSDQGDKALGNYTRALEDMVVAEEAHAGRVIEVRDSRFHDFDRDAVSSRSVEWLLQQHQENTNDPEAQEAIAERLLEREEEGEPLPRQGRYAVTRAINNLSARMASDGVYSDEEEARHSVMKWFGQKPDEDVSAAQATGATEADARREYEDMLAFEFIRSHEETNGVLLSKRGIAKGISSEALFRGPLSQVEPYASEELRSYWARHGRLTWAAYRFHALGRESDRGASIRARTQLPNDVALV